MIFQTSDDLSLYYETHGKPTQPPVILIHGIGAEHEMWKPQITSLPGAGYFVIVPDLRGHGKSEVPNLFRIVDCARDIKELLDHLNIQHVHLVGVSMGGMIVQQFVAQYPKRAISQVIVDSLSGISRPIERFNAGLAAVLLKVFPPKLQAYMIRSSYKKMQHDDVGKYFEDRLLHTDSRWLLAARLEVNQFNVFDELPKMNIPTLVLVGDAFGKLAIDMARTTAENIPGAQFQILKGGGDPSNLLVPKIFDQIVIDFLEQQSPKQ
ncbi:MAG: alpha/beta fold hydrolase [Anaerolineae bacterium]|nr:alpha/beta fold hydrolase [Anaerolineae bacterium]